MSRNILLGIGVLLVLGVAAWFFLRQAPAVLPAGPSTDSHQTPFVVPPLAGTYTNAKYHFSLALPEGFTAGELPGADGADTVILQNKKGDGIQIIIRPFGEDLHVLTRDRIHQDIPDMKISDVENVTIGPTYTGVAFISDNEAFGGSSREVWFVFRGNLYQVSTYARLDGLLKAMFATWKFQ